MSALPAPRSVLSLLVFVVLAACGGGGGGGGGSGNSNAGSTAKNITASCNKLSWNKTSTAPLSGITVTGVDDTLEQLAARPDRFVKVRIRAGGNEVGAMPAKLVTRNQKPALQVGIPPHPDAPFQGGSLKAVLAFGDSTCAAQSISVSALSAPSNPRQVIDDAIQEMETFLSDRATLFGYSTLSELENKRQRILNQGEGFTVVEMVMVNAADALANLKKETASSKLTPESEKLFAAMLERVGTDGFAGGLTKLNQQMPVVPALIDPDTDLSGATLVENETGNFVATKAKSSGGGGSCATTIVGKPVPINSALELDKYMAQQAKAKEWMDSYGGGLDLVSLTLPAAGLIGGPAGSAAGAGASFMIYAYQVVQEITINTLPSRFDRLQVNLVPGPRFPEDYHLPNPDPAWGNVRATVSSNGTNLTGKAVGAALQVFGVGLAGKAAKDLPAAWATAKQSSVLSDIASTYGEAGTLYAGEFVKNVLKNQSLEADCLTIDPWTWSGINITDKEYTTPTFIGPEIALTSASSYDNLQQMRPEQTGTGTLLVETDSNSFGGRHGEVRRDIEVDKIELLPQPSPYWVNQPGETRTFKIKVGPPDAELARRQVRATFLTGGGAVTQLPMWQGSYHEMKVRTPTDTSKYPVKIRVEQNAPLPDPSGSKVRTATLTIRNDQEVQLTPDKRCIGRNETLQLSADVRGLASLNPGDLSWTVSQGGGSVTPGSISGITQQATYSAPGSGTTATVRAEYTTSQGQTVSDNSRVAVGTCDAEVYIDGSFSLDVDAGTEDFEYDSDQDAFDLPDLAKPGNAPNPAHQWQGRTEQFATAGSARDQVQTRCIAEDSNGNCSQYARERLEGRAGGDASIGVNGDGDIAFGMNVTGNTTCLAADTNGDAENEEVRCSNARAGAAWQARQYFDIDDGSAREVKVTLECSESLDALGTVYVALSGLRWPSDGSGYNFQGQTLPLLPLDIASVQTYIDRINNGSLNPNQLGQNQSIMDQINNPCTSDGSVNHTMTLDVAAPAQASRAETGMIQMAISTGTGILTTTQKEKVRKQQSGNAQGTVVTGIQSRPGGYGGTTDIQGTIEIQSK